MRLSAYAQVICARAAGFPVISSGLVRKRVGDHWRNAGSGDRGAFFNHDKWRLVKTQMTMYIISI